VIYLYLDRLVSRKKRKADTSSAPEFLPQEVRG
jgi:hypothetical protein